MASHGESRTTARSWRRTALLVALAGLSLASLLGLGLYYGLPRKQPPVPDPDRSAMEPQVAAKIEETRQAVLAAIESHEAWGRLGMVLQAHGLEKDAAECYQGALELAPNEFRWRYLLAHALRKVDRQEALAQAELASKLRPDYSPTYVLRGQILEESGQPDQAKALYENAVALDPESAPAEFGLGRLHLARGKLEDSLRHLVRARDLSEDVAAIRGALAQAFRRLGEQEAALRENRLASQLTGIIAIKDPVHYAMLQESVSSLALLERAILADGAGDYQRAEALYRELLQLRPQDADIRARFGDLLARQSRLQPAKEQYQAALGVNPRHASAHYGLGNMLNFEGNYDQAAEHYRDALAARPDHIPTMVNLGSLLAFQGKPEEAAALFRKALDIEPKAFGANRQLGQLLVQQHRYSEAVPYLRAALESRPDSAPVHLQLGLALAANGDFLGAWKHLKTAREMGEPIPEQVLEELRKRVPEANR